MRDACLPMRKRLGDWGTIEDFALGAHAQYFRVFLDRPLPEQMQGMDSNRLTVAYFAAAGLELLGELGVNGGGLSATEKNRIIAWVVSLQIVPRRSGASGGFRGAPFFTGSSGGEPCANLTNGTGRKGADGERAASTGEPVDGSRLDRAAAWDLGHIAMTYSALALLYTCGSGLEHVDVAGAAALVQALQADDGSVAAHLCGERDMRFLYCAAAICALIGDWRPLDVPRAVAWVLSCQVALPPAGRSRD